MDEQTKTLGLAEIVTGMELMMRARSAAAVASAQQDALELYVDHLRRLYAAPAADWDMVSWTSGFVRKDGGQNDTGNNQ